MPNIVEYNATGEITPSDKGIQAAEVAGRRLGQLGSEIAEGTRGVARNIKDVTDKIQDHMAVMETSELYKTGEELKVNLQQKYETESAQPENRNNPYFSDQFMAEAGPLIDKWKSGATTDHGRLLAAEMGANIRNEVFHHVAAGQGEMDTANVSDNYKQLINTLGAGLAYDPSETNLNRSLGVAQDAGQGMTMSIRDPETRARVASELKAWAMPQLVFHRYQMVGESIKSQIAATGGDTSPAAEQLDKDITKQVGFQYLSPEMQSRVSEVKNEAVRQGQEMFRAKDATQRKADSDAFDAALLPIETSLFQPNGSGGVTMHVTPDALDAVQRAALMPGAKQHPEKIEALLNAMHTATQDAITGKETVTDRSTFIGLSGMIGSTTNPLTTVEVDRARAAGKLSDSDYSFLRSSAVDSKAGAPKVTHAMTELNHWLEQVKPTIDQSDPLFGKIDQGGAVQFSKFAWDAQNKVRQAIAAGEDPDKAVQRLTDPRNARGLYSFIPQYQGSQGKAGMARVLHAMQSGEPQALPAAPGAKPTELPPVKPGEDMDAWRKRVGK